MSNDAKMEILRQKRCELVGWDDLTPDEQSDLDYIDNPEDRGYDFFRFEENVYDLCDILIAPDSIKAMGFHGFNSDSHFSGVAVRCFPTKEEIESDDPWEDGEHVVAAIISIS